MRFDWEPRPVPEGLKQIERNQKHSENVAKLQSQLGERANWGSRARWEVTSQSKAAFVECHLENEATRSAATSQTVSRPRETVAEVLRAEEQHRKAEAASRKLGAALRREENIVAARVLAAQQQSKYIELVERKLDAQFMSSCDQLRQLQSQRAARYIDGEQRRQVEEKHGQEAQTAARDMEFAHKVHAEVAKHEAEEARAGQRRQAAAATLAQSLEEQMDLRERLNGENAVETRKTDLALQAARVKEAEAQQQEQTAERQRQLAVRKNAVEENAWQHAQRQQRTQREFQDSALLLFHTLSAEKQAALRAKVKEAQRQATNDAYYAQLEAELDAELQQQVDKDAEVRSAWDREQSKRYVVVCPSLKHTYLGFIHKGLTVSMY
jgi:hypothetical protein